MCFTSIISFQTSNNWNHCLTNLLTYKTANQFLRDQTYSGGGGLVRAHTTDRSRFFPCQPCPVLQLPSAWEIPRERRAEVGLRPLNLILKMKYV